MCFFSNNHEQVTSVKTRGFSLVELMVTISIMMLLSVIILVRNSSFNGAVLLRSQAYEVAFALRQAQLLAVSGNNVGGAAGKVQQYGVSFNKSGQTYQIFHDLDADGQMDSGTEEYGPVGHLDRRFEIRDVTDTGGTSVMANSILNVYFTRPNFDAQFEKGDSASFAGPVYIDVSKVDESGVEVGTVRRVQVTKTGQISVTKYP